MIVNQCGDTISVPDTLKNLNEWMYSYIIILFIILFISFTAYVLLRKNKSKMFMLIALLSILIIPISTYALCKCEIKINSKIEIKKNYDGNGIIYTEREFGVYLTDHTHPYTGGSISFLSEIKNNPKWCEYIIGSENNNEDYCEYNTEQECTDFVGSTSCYVKIDGSWNSCVDGNYSLSTESCQSKIQNDISEGYALPGEYTCEKNDKFGCRPGSKIEGDYTIFRNLINQKLFYKYETENYIIKKSYLCFITDKEYCFDGDSNNYQDNITILKNQQDWFNENGGSCSFNDEEKSGSCSGAGYEGIHVKEYGVEAHLYLSYTLQTYCIYGGHSFCGD